MGISCLSRHEKAREMPVFKFTLNGATVSVDTEGDRPLLDVLREEFGLTGAKFGCGEGQCRACTVMLVGRPAFWGVARSRCRRRGQAVPPAGPDPRNRRSRAALEMASTAGCLSFRSTVIA